MEGDACCCRRVGGAFMGPCVGNRRFWPGSPVGWSGVGVPWQAGPGAAGVFLPPASVCAAAFCGLGRPGGPRPRLHPPSGPCHAGGRSPRPPPHPQSRRRSRRRRPTSQPDPARRRRKPWPRHFSLLQVCGSIPVAFCVGSRHQGPGASGGRARGEGSLAAVASAALDGLRPGPYRRTGPGHGGGCLLWPIL